VFVRGKAFTDSDGVLHQGKVVTYDRECLKMQTKGLLNAGADRPVKDSTGEPCRGCNQTIEPGDKHAHRHGNPFHRECLY
jgi:hypothetical protein